jgi:hypothetical protein
MFSKLLTKVASWFVVTVPVQMTETDEEGFYYYCSVYHAGYLC